MNITIIKPNNQKEKIKYYDLLYFCQKTVEEYISMSKENLEKFQEYREHYSFFDPYFDFVMLELKYIILDPFFYQNTYLLTYKNEYFIMDYNNEEHNELISKKPLFSFDFLPATDLNIGLQKHTRNLYRQGFYIDLNGKIYKNTMMKRHLAMARTILNQRLIHEASTCFSYYRYVEEYGENAMCDFLIKKLGYVSGCQAEENVIIYNPKTLTKEQNQKIIECQIKYQTKSEEYHKSLIFR